MSTITVPPIYIGMHFPPRMSVGGRLLAVLVSAAALGVLLIAAWLKPDPRGFGTHEALGLQPCGFLQRTGIPCAGCGMTTSFADAVRGHVVASFIAQPFGLVLCLMTAIAFWSALYVAITGRPAYRLLSLVPPRAHLIAWPAMALAAWVWKIAAMAGH